jgi:uncharacterized protein DUF4240
VAGDFWELIDQARAAGKSCAEGARALERILGELSLTEIEAFAREQEDLMRTSYRWDLWGAAFVINGGCSDDGFDYFRGWLMLQGRDVWEAALREPESLAGVSFEGNAACEDALYSAGKAYESVAGRGLPPPRDRRPDAPSGTAWQETDLAALYPRLWERFSAEGDQREAADTGFYVEGHWERQNEKGYALLASSAFDSAARTFAQVRERAPGHLTRTLATNNLAWADLMIDTPAAVKEALPLANEALQSIEAEPQKAVYVWSIKATLAFALIKNGDPKAGLALMEEVSANERSGPHTSALRLCVLAIGLARTGDVVRARDLVRQALRTHPQCQLLPQAERAVVGSPIVVPEELQGLAPLVQRFGVSDDVEREHVVNGSSTEELIALVNAVTKQTFDQINQFLDRTFDAEDAVPFGDLAQAAVEARLELKHRGVTDLGSS